MVTQAVISAQERAYHASLELAHWNDAASVYWAEQMFGTAIRDARHRYDVQGEYPL